MGLARNVVFAVVLFVGTFVQAQYHPSLLLSRAEFKSLSVANKLKYTILYSEMVEMLSHDHSIELDGSPYVSSLLWSLFVEPAYCAYKSKKRAPASPAPTGKCIVCGFVSEFRSNGKCKARDSYEFQGKTLKCTGGKVLCNPSIFGTDGGEGACIDKKGNDFTAQARAKFLERCRPPVKDENKKACKDLPEELAKYRSDKELEEMNKLMEETCSPAVQKNYPEKFDKFKEDVEVQKQLGKALALGKTGGESDAEKEEKARIERLKKTPGGVEEGLAKKRLNVAEKERLEKEIAALKCGWWGTWVYKGFDKTPECERKRVLEAKLALNKKQEVELNKPADNKAVAVVGPAANPNKKEEDEIKAMEKRLETSTKAAHKKFAQNYLNERARLARQAASLKGAKIEMDPVNHGHGAPKKPGQKDRLSDFADACIKLAGARNDGTMVIGEKPEGIGTAQ